MTEAINHNTPDYIRGLADGYKEGFNAALEELAALEQLHSLLHNQFLQAGIIPEEIKGTRGEMNRKFIEERALMRKGYRDWLEKNWRNR